MNRREILKLIGVSTVGSVTGPGLASATTASAHGQTIEVAGYVAGVEINRSFGPHHE